MPVKISGREKGCGGGLRRNMTGSRERVSGSADMFRSEDGGRWFFRQWSRSVFSVEKRLKF